MLVKQRDGSLKPEPFLTESRSSVVNYKFVEELQQSNRRFFDCVWHKDRTKLRQDDKIFVMLTLDSRH